VVTHCSSADVASRPAQVMHRDICSSNIMVAEEPKQGEPGGVYIIDFGLSTTTRQEELTTPVSVDAAGTAGATLGAGSLAYISPEQTGRMNRAPLTIAPTSTPWASPCTTCWPTGCLSR
jgi:serine/threonine protein kinase